MARQEGERKIISLNARRPIHPKNEPVDPDQPTGRVIAHLGEAGSWSNQALQIMQEQYGSTTFTFFNGRYTTVSEELKEHHAKKDELKAKLSGQTGPSDHGA